MHKGYGFEEGGEEEVPLEVGECKELGERRHGPLQRYPFYFIGEREKSREK